MRAPEVLAATIEPSCAPHGFCASVHVIAGTGASAIDES
jgi:hypothetical protein